MHAYDADYAKLTGRRLGWEQVEHVPTFSPLAPSGRRSALMPTNKGHSQSEHAIGS